MTTPEIDEQGRPEPKPAGTELETLLGFLDYQRATLEWKTRGLDAAGFRARVGASSMTLGGLLKHLAGVEQHWFSVYLHQRPCEPMWDVAYAEDFDWPFTSATDDTPEELRRLWHDSVEKSRADVALALEGGDLEQLTKSTWSNGEAPSLRWVIVT